VELVSPELVLVAPPELRRLALQGLDAPMSVFEAPREAARRLSLGAAVFVTLLCANGVAPLFLIFATHR
jgi:hypothetical protein